MSNQLRAAWLLMGGAVGNRAGVFDNEDRATLPMTQMPAIGNKDFKLAYRFAKLTDRDAYNLMINTENSLDAAGFYQRNGATRAYFQSLEGDSFFREICSAAETPIGQFFEVSFERAGNLFTARFNGATRWTETRSIFTIDLFKTLNINFRGGSGGGFAANVLVDYIYLDVTESNGQVVRYMDLNFNEADGVPTSDEGALGGELGYFPYNPTYLDL